MCSTDGKLLEQSIFYELKKKDLQLGQQKEQLQKKEFSVPIFDYAFAVA